MPYIITTTRRTHRCTNPAHEHVTRRAVAALDKVRDVIYALGANYGHMAHLDLDGTSHLPITLPDGTMIKVERTTYLALDGSEGMGETEPIEPATHKAILEAYNAAQS